LVTPAELQGEYERRKDLGLPADPPTIREEAAIARLIRSDAERGTVARFLDAIRAAIKRVFGFEVRSGREQLKEAALEFLRNRDSWQGARGVFSECRGIGSGGNGGKRGVGETRMRLG